jgi:DNA-binding MarR family transcriptional regulator
VSKAERQEIRRLLRVVRAYRAAFSGLEAGLSGRDLEVLLILAVDGPCSGAEISRGLDRDRAATSRALARLRALKLVRRTPAASRAQLNQLTSRGHSQIQRILRSRA